MIPLTEIKHLTLMRAAEAYISAGWPVLPLKPRGKEPLSKNGLHDASTDRDQIRDWWGRWPTANIGLRTGIMFDVLDIDGPPGIQSLTTLVPGYKHPGPVSSTGKGFHLLFEPTGARNAAARMPGLDFRGQNGYIVAPPSVHPNGHRYVWARDGDIPAPPAWLDQLVTPPRPPLAPRDPALEAAIADNPILPLMQDMFESIDGIDIYQIGGRYIANCFIDGHDDDTPSLVIYPDTNSFFCFGCNEYGDSMNIVTYLKTGSLR